MADDIDILSLNIEELWNIYKKQADIEDSDFSKVRDGIDIKFDIISYFQRFGIRLKEKKGLVRINNTNYHKRSIDTELLKRERIMSEFLIEKNAKKPIAKIREKNE